MPDLISLDPDPVPMPGGIALDEPPSAPGFVSSFLGALASGAKKSLTDVAGVVHPFTDQSPIQPDTGPTAQLLAEPFSQGKFNPAWYAARLGQGIGGSGPMLGGAVLGGAAGEAIEPVGGGLVGAPIGAFAGSVVQELAPAYQAARAAGQTHDQAVETAWKSASVSGATGALMTIAPVFKLFGTTAEGALKKPVSEMLAQIFGVQPAIGTAGAAAQGAVTGQPLTPEQLAESYLTNAGVGAAMVGAHSLLPPLTRLARAPAGESGAAPVAPEPIALDRAPVATAGIPAPDLAPGAVVGIRGPDGLPQRAQIQRIGDGLVHWVGEDGTPRVDDLPAFQRDVTAAPAPTDAIRGDATTVPIAPPAPAGEPHITAPDQFVQQFRNGPIEPDVPASPEKQMPLPMPMPKAEVAPAPVAEAVPYANKGDLWTLPQESLAQMLNEKSMSDQQKLVQALGEDGAAEFKRVDRRANSANPDIADPAIARLGEIESSLTPEQNRLVYGVGETDAQADDIKAVLDAHEPFALDAKGNGPSPEQVGYLSSLGIRKVSPQDILAVPQGGGSAEAQAAYVRLMRGYEELTNRGIAPDEVPNTLARGMAQGSGMSPGDAADFVGSFLDAAKQSRPAADVAALPALPAPAETPDAMRADLAAAGAGDAATIKDADLPERWAQLQAVQPQAAALPRETLAQSPQTPETVSPNVQPLQPLPATTGPAEQPVLPQVPSPIHAGVAAEAPRVGAGTAPEAVAPVHGPAPEGVAARAAAAEPTETPTEAVIPGLSGEKTVADPGAVATGIKAAAKAFGDMLLDDQGSVPQRAKALTDAERIAAEVKASQPDSLKAISGIAQHTALAQSVAEKDPLGARYLDARQNRNAARHAYQADAQAAGSAWLRLPEARQKAIDKVMEYQTMTGHEVQDTGRPVVVHYDAARDFPGRPNPLQIIKDGETVRLSAAESKMVHDMNGFFDRAWKQSAQADATKFGYTGPFLKEGAGGRMEFDKAAIQSAIDNATDKGARLAAERAMGFAQTAEDSARQGYFPLMRYGDWTIAVTPKVPKNPEGYPLRDEGWFAKVDSKDPFASLKGQLVGEDLTKTPKRVAQEMARLKQRFPDADYHMEAKRQSPKTADTVDLAMVSRVLADTKLTDPETGKRLADDVIAKLYDEAKAGYKRPREGIPGYSTDFARAYSDYARQWSSVTASKLHGNAVQDAYDATQVGPDRRAAKYWDAYHQHNENPQPWIYGAMKRVGFFNYLWGSPSSAMIQLTQTPLITGTQLGLLVGHTRAQYMANTLAARALSAVRTGRSGLMLDVKDVPGVTARERTALAQADREGRLNPVLPTDFAGGQFSPEMRRRFAPAVRVYDIGASMFNTADRANRIASWLSAYRAAQLPGMAAKAARIYRNDALYRQQVGPQMDPAKYANWFMNETQFLSGREGSSPLMRGAGSVLFQFQHYNTNMLRLMRKNLVKMGPEGKAAFGVMLTGLVLGAGIGGLPFVNDAERLANQVGKWINDGVDPRLDARFHQMIADSGFAQMAAAYFGTDPLHVAEFALEGGSRSVLGLDLGRRIGLGNILPSNTDLFTAVPFLDATVGKAMEASKRYQSGQPEGAVAALLPAALANPYKGYVSWPGEGINPQSGTTPYFLPSQVTPGMQAARALGFQPAEVARRQEFMNDQNAVKFATDQPAKDAANALAGIFARQADAQQHGDTASAAYYQAQGNKLIQQYGAALADPNTPAWEKVPLPTRTALTNRIKLYLSQPGTLNIQRADKLKRQEMLNSPYLSQ